MEGRHKLPLVTGGEITVAKNTSSRKSDWKAVPLSSFRGAYGDQGRLSHETPRTHIDCHLGSRLEALVQPVIETEGGHVDSLDMKDGILSGNIHEPGFTLHIEPKALLLKSWSSGSEICWISTWPLPMSLV